MDNERYNFIWGELCHLTWEQALVIYQKCDPNVQASKLGEHTPFPQGTAYRHLEHGTNRLRLDQNNLPEEYCNVLYDMVERISNPDRPNDPPDWKNNWPPVNKEETPSTPQTPNQEEVPISELRQPDPEPESPPSETPTDSPIFVQPQSRPRDRQTNWWQMSTMALVGIIALFGFWRLVQLVVWDCNPLTSSIVCGTINEGETEIADNLDGSNVQIHTASTPPSPLPSPDSATMISMGQTIAAQTAVFIDMTRDAEATIAVETGAALIAEEIVAERETATSAAIPTATFTNTPTLAPTLTPSITPTASNTPTITPIPPLLFDDFEDGDLLLWSAAGGSEWIVDEDENGQHTAYCLRPGGLLFPDEGWTDYTISADVKMIAVGESVGVIARRLSNERFYIAELTGSQAQIRYVRNVVAGSGWSVLESIDYPAQLNTVYNIALRVRGIQLTMYVNGVEVISLTHSAYASGRVGIRCGNNTIATFDNILVEEQ